MDRIRKFDSCSLGILEDPALKTTAANFPFQYIPMEQFEHVIKTVQRDRLKQKKNIIWTELSRATKPSKSITSDRTKKTSKSKKKVIKTPTSTVKILTQQMVEEDILKDEVESCYSPNREYMVPRVRIMTDDEIQKVVENAVREVIEKQDNPTNVSNNINHNRNKRQHDDNNIVLKTSHNIETKSDDDENSSGLECISSIRKVVIISAKNTSQNDDIIEMNREYENLPHLSVELENNFDDIAEKPEEDEEENESLSIALQDLPEHDFKNEEKHSPKWVEVNETGDAKPENCISVKSDNCISARSEISQSARTISESRINVDTRDARIEHNKPVENNDELISERPSRLPSPGASTSKSNSDENNEIVERQEPSTSAMNKQQEIKNPTLSAIEREELRKLLGIKEMIVNSQIDLDRFDEDEKDTTEESDEDEVDEEESNQKNIFPIIHIRQPIPMEWVMESAESDIEDNVSNNTNRKCLTPPKIEQEKPKTQNITKKISEPLQNHISTKNSEKEKSRPKKNSERLEKNSLQNSARTPNMSGQNSARVPNNSVQNLKETQNSARQQRSLVETPKSRIHPQSPQKKTTQISMKSSRNPKQQSLEREEISSVKLNELNEEKMLIYSKITSYQEKIIELLDQLRVSLLNLTVPDGQPERKRREKHVIEFCARFGRNYLYQLERMIDEIRAVPKDQYLSKYTNEHRTKVCAIYGILYQAVQSYLKQIKYFLLDQSPKKLDILIGLIIDATKTCIRKKIFDRRDNLISCLVGRCKDLLGFLEEIKEQRNNTINTLMAPRNKKHGNDKSATSKWNMAVMPSKLSMYESSAAMNSKRKPSSQPSSQQGVKPQKKRAPRNKSEKKPTKKNVSEMKVCSMNDEKMVTGDNCEKQNENLSNKASNSSNLVQPDIEVNTQMEQMVKDSAIMLSPTSHRTRHSSQDDDITNLCVDSSRAYIEAIDQSGDNADIAMKRKVFEALQTITQKQVHEILGPLVSNLGFVLNENTSSLDLGTLFDGLNSVNTQMINVSSTGNDTFNQKEGMHKVCEDGERLDEHAVSNEQQLDLSQSKQRAQALWNRQLNPLTTTTTEALSGEEECYVDNTSPQHLARMEELPVTTRLDLPTIQEERSGTRMEKERKPIPQVLEDEGGASIASGQNVKGKKVHQLRYDRNVQFTFVSSENDGAIDDATGGAAAATAEQKQPINLEFNLPLDDDCCSSDGDQNYYDIDNSMPEKVQEEIHADHRVLENILEDRLNFIQQIAENPLYVNGFFSQPWKIVTRLTDRIMKILTDSVEKDLSFGEESYIDDFLRLELAP